MRRQNSKIVTPPDAHGQTVTPEPTVLPFGAKPSVLVVDDDHMVGIMVQLGLERIGFEVLLASDGREAIDLFRAHSDHIAVVLLDVRMPSFDGVQTLDGLRELDGEVPVCFMSGDTGCYEPDELLQRGAAHVIAKPFRLEKLASILRLLASRVPGEVLHPDVCSG